MAKPILELVAFPGEGTTSKAGEAKETRRRDRKQLLGWNYKITKVERGLVLLQMLSYFSSSFPLSRCHWLALMLKHADI